MKKLLPFVLLLFTLFANGQSTTYHPFPERSAIWNFTYVALNMSGPEDYMVNYSITFSGDTLINNLTYHKLTTPFANSYVISYGYRGAIRQDIVAKKVFIIPPTKTSEQLLYDFTLQVGDTVKGYISLSQCDTVESIDTVLVGTSFRKRWLINSEYHIDIIEGIGSLYGLIEYSPGHGADFPYFYLGCYQENNQTLLPDMQSNCTLVTSVKSINTNSDQIQILSNNESATFTIKFDNANILEIMLVDMSGKVIFRQPTKNKNEIVIDHLKSGFYILTARDCQNQLITKKLISCP